MKNDEFREFDATELNEEESKKFNNDNWVDNEKDYTKFYEKLKFKFRKKSNKKINKISDYLFLLPDFFMLFIRLLKDPRIEKRMKFFIVGVIAYVISPLDIIPDFIPIIGYVDDLVLVVFALNSMLNDIDAEIVQDNWSGQSDMLQKLKDISTMAEKLFSKRILNQIKSWIYH
ncbi:MAG: DUF1232 domain-containing protein, partial [Candidatus Cloacimonadota bacterium]|nr:DUF1232 domain-containing protein [Candidatus Cloacimonadota bacterium]